ncbi:S-layer protein [Levilactobacillus brevis]|uniref:S-layer protein n=1 Tax=Levilactobacillus brevis TaxID=1580 RepID=A0AAJ5FEZ6_LEVBR|nr:S-layer protein [Levilactobacillus brevis]TOZ01383.1 S-layer protein [Levilactobacillus brevis]
MRSSFAKSIYVGAAVLGLAGLSAVTTTTASAKSYATAGSYTALTKGQNVLVNGTNAIYSKPGTVKGAKVVASKKTVAKLAASKKSSDTFYAYGTKTTNRGSVYYKIVTMDKKYRGYIYGGKTAGTFAGGIKTTDTVKDATNPTRTAGYYLKDVSKNTLWTAPKNTDINAKKVSLYGVRTNDTFTVDKAQTKAKEGSLYYHVTDDQNKAVSGWIYAGKGYDTTITDNTKQDLGGLSLTLSDAAATADNSIKVVYRDATSKAQVASKTWVVNANDTKAGDAQTATQKNAANLTLGAFITNSKPNNYAFPTGTTYDDTFIGGVYGNTVYVDVNAQATSKVQFTVSGKPNNTVDDNAVTLTTTPALNSGDVLAATDVTVTGKESGSLTTLTNSLTAAKGGTISDPQLGTIADNLGDVNIIGSKQYYDAQGTAYHYVFTLNNDGSLFTNNNTGSVFGSTLKASVKAQLTKTTSNNTTSDSSWIA